MAIKQNLIPYPIKKQKPTSAPKGRKADRRKMADLPLVFATFRRAALPAPLPAATWAACARTSALSEGLRRLAGTSALHCRSRPAHRLFALDRTPDPYSSGPAALPIQGQRPDWSSTRTRSFAGLKGNNKEDQREPVQARRCLVVVFLF